MFLSYHWSFAKGNIVSLHGLIIVAKAGAALCWVFEWTEVWEGAWPEDAFTESIDMGPLWLENI